MSKAGTKFLLTQVVDISGAGITGELFADSYQSYNGLVQDIQIGLVEISGGFYSFNIDTVDGTSVIQLYSDGSKEYIPSNFFFDDTTYDADDVFGRVVSLQSAPAIVIPQSNFSQFSSNTLSGVYWEFSAQIPEIAVGSQNPSGWTFTAEARSARSLTLPISASEFLPVDVTYIGSDTVILEIEATDLVADIVPVNTNQVLYYIDVKAIDSNAKEIKPIRVGLTIFRTATE